MRPRAGVRLYDRREWAYIGCQRVEPLDGDDAPYFQTRFWARIELEPFEPTHEMTARRLVVPGEFLTGLFWGRESTATLILERGLRIQAGGTGELTTAPRT